MTEAAAELARLRDENAELELKVTELSHRIKNLLTVVQAVAHQTLRAGKTPGEMRDLLDQRLAALSRGIDLLQRKNWTTAELSDVIASAFSSSAHRFILSGPDCAIDAGQSLGLVLLFQELECNAIKYGSLSRSIGTVEVEWSLDGADAAEPALDLRWSERGGPATVPPAQLGTGTKLIERLARRMRGQTVTDFGADGLRWHLRLPLSVLHKPV